MLLTPFILTATLFYLGGLVCINVLPCAYIAALVFLIGATNLADGAANLTETLFCILEFTLLFTPFNYLLSDLKLRGVI